MEKEAAFPNDAPSGWGGTPMLPGGKPTTLARLSFYRDVLGATVVHELAGTLCSRGADFLTSPFDWSDEVRAFFHDPDGHLLEIREVREAEVSSE
jgi:hypothetical protein